MSSYRVLTGYILSCLLAAGESLEDVHYCPQDELEKRENVEKVLQFVSSKRIRMPQTSSRGE